MIELIATIIFISSFLGMFVIAARKIPEIRELEASDTDFFVWFNAVKQKIQKNVFSKLEKFQQADFWDIWWQKALSKIKILSLRIESKSTRLLEKSRERNKRKKQDTKYWEKISKISLKKKKK